MQVGGLSPPPPLPAIQPTPGARRTEEQLEEAKKKDSGRGLTWVWLAFDGGYQHVGLQTFNADDPKLTAGLVDTSADGAVAGAGLGVRLLFFTIGARGRLGFFESWKTYSVGGELGLRIPLGIVEPHVEVGGGYTTLASIVDTSGAALDAMHIRGFYVRVGTGLDVFLTRWLSLGAGATWDVLGLSRPALAAAEVARIKARPGLTDAELAKADLLGGAATSFGSGIAVTASLGLHF